jgi:hypothetical protein
MKSITFKDIYIPSPCNADWDKMENRDRSRFCKNCNKIVYDFTQRSEEDLNKLIQETGKGFCGRFYEDQIDQNLRLSYRKRSLLQSFIKTSLSLLSIIALKLLTVSYVLSREIKASHATDKFPVNLQQSKQINSPYSIDGKVVVKNSGEGIAGVTVKIFIDDILIGITTTGELGIFKLSIEKEISPDAKITVESERKEFKSKNFKTIYKSSESKFTRAQSHNIIFELKIKHKRKFPLKRRRIVAGYYRY